MRWLHCSTTEPSLNPFCGRPVSDRPKTDDLRKNIVRQLSCCGSCCKIRMRIRRLKQAETRKTEHPSTDEPPNPDHPGSKTLAATNPEKAIDPSPPARAVESGAMTLALAATMPIGCSSVLNSVCTAYWYLYGPCTGTKLRSCCSVELLIGQVLMHVRLLVLPLACRRLLGK
jgi:hypothetical protein